MNIQWFPGHMKKALRLIEENLKQVDLIVYVLDSRAIFSCLNPAFFQLFNGKKIIYALNKADLVPRSHVEEWLDILSTEQTRSLSVNATASNSTNSIVTLAKKLCENKLVKLSQKGVKATIRVMVAGVPNCGKSTLINSLCKDGKTMTGNKPGVTRGKQWVRVNDYFELLDTPGTLYPKLTDQAVARRLAYIGSIRDEVTDTLDLAYSLLSELLPVHHELLSERFGFDFSDCMLTLDDAFDKMARKRGYLLRGGNTDVERMATAFIDDFRKGRIGKIMLERAGDYGNIELI